MSDNYSNINNPEPLKPSGLMVKMIMLAALIIIIIGVVFYRSLAVFPFALGVLITSGLNIIKMRMLERTVQKIIYMDDQEAGKNIIRFQYLLRYFLTGIVLVAIGLIQNYTSPPPIYSSRDWYIGVWAFLFPNAPDTLIYAPFISVWGAVAGIFTLQIAVIIVRSFKLEKDGDNFIKYDDDFNVISDNKDTETDEEIDKTEDEENNDNS